ncbi:alpha/beta hydrolase [Pseudomaricurvus alkylphenolicus]|uniref:alpha/beta hydrolase n=1 Tax=Pseudomaricurvus alkylphenolicus TaxID=1306991 RepID=UPI00141DC8AB|nr:alpha/beta hydrolase [Pseudomaricurvus alkylphenolicus]NIB38189.1 alpha/beta hydrolase [Pseudomaricurvus alkylphenolicus]
MPLHPFFEAMTKRISEIMESQDLPPFRDRNTEEILEARKNYELLQPPAPHIEVGRVENIEIDGPESKIPVRIYRPKSNSDDPLPILLYFHGGGFHFGSSDTHDGSNRLLCNLVDCIVISPDYRLAPEHLYPAAHDDCWATLNWVYEHAKQLGGDRERIAIAGDSAGGSLTIGMAVRARENGHPKLCFHAPIVAGDGKFTEISSDGKMLDPMLTIDSACSMVGRYLGAWNPDNPELECSKNWSTDLDIVDSDGNVQIPKRYDLFPESLQDLCPAICVAAEFDVCTEGMKRYAEGLKHAGVPTVYYEGKGMMHAFTAMAHLNEDLKKELEKVAEFMKDAFS